MKTQHYTVLARRSRSGDAAARKKLLMESYMCIAHQCRHILLNSPAAETITREILQTMNTMLDKLENPRDYVLEMQKLIAQETASWLSERDWGSAGQSAGKPYELPGKLLDESQTTELVMRLVDDLPAEQRLCAVLWGCGEMSREKIAEGSGIPLSTVEVFMERAEKTVNKRLDKFRQEGVLLVGMGSLELMLTDAMLLHRNEMTAAAVAESVMGSIRTAKSPALKASKRHPVKKAAEKKRKRSSGLIAAIVILLIVLIGLGIFGLYLEWLHRDDWMLQTVPLMLPQIQFFL